MSSDVVPFWVRRDCSNSFGAAYSGSFSTTTMTFGASAFAFLCSTVPDRSHPNQHAYSCF